MMFPQTAHLPVLQQHPSATPFSWIPAWQCGVPPSLSFLLFLLMEVQHLVHKPVGLVGGRESCPKEGCGEKLGMGEMAPGLLPRAGDGQSPPWANPPPRMGTQPAPLRAQHPTLESFADTKGPLGVQPHASLIVSVL